MTHRDVDFGSDTGDRGHCEAPNAHVVGEVLLIDLRVVTVVGRPSQVPRFTERECIAKLVVKVQSDVAPDTCRNGALASGHHEERRCARKDGDVHDHLLAAGWV